jgi:hypothetical protein
MNTGGKTAKEPGLDEKTIKIMRSLCDASDINVRTARKDGLGWFFVNGNAWPLDDLSVAVDAFRALVDQAAERVESEAVAPTWEEAEALGHVCNGLKQAVASASRNGDEYVRISVENSSYGLFPSTADAAARAIEALLAAQPAKPEPAEPTLEECFEAIERAGREIARRTFNGRFWVNTDEARRLGRLLIERERAAKGGA